MLLEDYNIVFHGSQWPLVQKTASANRIFCCNFYVYHCRDRKTETFCHMQNISI